MCLVELRGFEPLTPCMPLMLGWFTTPCTTSRVHITAQVRDAAEGWVVGRREATCSAVSGKSLARTPARQSVLARLMLDVLIPAVGFRSSG